MSGKPGIMGGGARFMEHRTDKEAYFPYWEVVEKR